MHNHLQTRQLNKGTVYFVVCVSLLFIIFSFHTINAALAIKETTSLKQADCDSLKIDCSNSSDIIITRILSVVNELISLILIIVTIALLYGAFKYIASTGDEAEAKRAKQIIIYAIIGLIIIGISGIAVNAFINTLSPALIKE